LKYLWKEGSLGGRKSFAALHLERVLRRDVAAAPETQSSVEGHAGPTS
jgi:hypothetical protein